MTQKMLLDPTGPLALLRRCPAYEATPLVRRSEGSKSFLIKDETQRMGLGAFKAMGGVYAVAQLIAQMSGEDVPQTLGEDGAFARAAKEITFVCASAGNHGMAVAAGARLFGASARIHLAETVPEDFAHRLQTKGADVVRSGPDYEASVAAAIADAAQSGAVHLADGSWPGYTEPPRLVMEGYTVIAEEMRTAFEARGDWPSHVYLQAGVGGLAAAIAAMIRHNWSVQPLITVVEPDAAPCLRDSVTAGQIVTVEGPVSNMGRLDCKTPSMLAFDILKEAADTWATVTDAQAEEAVAQAAGLGIDTTPSGAAGLAAAWSEGDENPLVILSEGGVAAG